MFVEEIVGEYNIIGSNQDDSSNTYNGILKLALDAHNRIKASWLINNEQEQYGSGFFKDNILVINFFYFGEARKKFKGVAVYRCLSPDILDGFWSEKHGNLDYLGEERCFRVQTSPTLVN